MFSVILFNTRTTISEAKVISVQFANGTQIGAVGLDSHHQADR